MLRAPDVAVALRDEKPDRGAFMTNVFSKASGPAAIPTVKKNAGSGRYLVIVRAGDGSLHPSWLDTAGGERNWDLHISYFGKRAEPATARAPGVTWTQNDQNSKWPGVAAALANLPVSLDDYDYVAVADDDIVVEAQDWSRAFATAHARGLAAAQLSLLPGSFFGHPMTLRIPGMLLHYVTRIELMAPIIRTDVLKQLIPYMPMEFNSWGMDHVLSHIVRNESDALAVLDNASCLHTRRFWIGAIYQPYKDAGLTPYEGEALFLKSNGIPWLTPETLGGVDARGRAMSHAPRYSLSTLQARILRKVRDANGLERIAWLSDHGELILLRRFAGVRLGKVEEDMDYLSLPAMRGRREAASP